MPKTSDWKLTWSPGRQLYECFDLSATVSSEEPVAADRPEATASRVD
jgi:hypothetical protein